MNKEKVSEKTVQYRTRYDLDVMRKIEKEREDTGKGISEIVNKILVDHYNKK